MKLETIYYDPVAEVSLTSEEINYLCKCSEGHYDIVCKQAGRPGGFLYRVRVTAEVAAAENHHLSWRDLDTLSKINETGLLMGEELSPEIAKSIRTIMRTLQDVQPEPHRP